MEVLAALTTSRLLSKQSKLGNRFRSMIIYKHCDCISCFADVNLEFYDEETNIHLIQNRIKRVIFSSSI